MLATASLFSQSVPDFCTFELSGAARPLHLSTSESKGSSAVHVVPSHTHSLLQLHVSPPKAPICIVALSAEECTCRSSALDCFT